MSRARLFGIETEYAAAALGPDGAALPPRCVADAIVRAAERDLPALYGTCDRGLFLANGSRLYEDAGGHPELAGPECVNPWDVVRYARAGDRIVLRAAQAAAGRHQTIAGVRVFSGNVDYSGTRSTWGAHESYCHAGDSASIRHQLVPHLVSRVIYTGAGGFNPLSSGLEFTLSPRAHYLAHVVSSETTHERGIVDTRDESLARLGYRRQHVICGETLRSDLAAWLKIGTTALVVAMAEGGVACAEGLELACPTAAIRTFARDVACRAVAETTDGVKVSALDIQRRYLAHARACRGAAFLPRWTDAVCEQWEQMLDRLAGGPLDMSRTLDWAVKLAIYRDRAERRGFSWCSVGWWSVVVNAIDEARRAQPGPHPCLSAAMLQADPELRQRAAALVPLVRKSERQDRLQAFLALRDEVFEIDMRWGQLGPEGTFEALDRAGVLDHRVEGVDRIEEGIEQPPAGTRAHVRGTVIRRLSGYRQRYTAGWDQVWDGETCRRLNLSDPFTVDERWSAPEAAWRPAALHQPPVSTLP